MKFGDFFVMSQIILLWLYAHWLPFRLLMHQEITDSWPLTVFSCYFWNLLLVLGYWLFGLFSVHSFTWGSFSLQLFCFDEVYSCSEWITLFCHKSRTLFYVVLFRLQAMKNLQEFFLLQVLSQQPLKIMISSRTIWHFSRLN